MSARLRQEIKSVIGVHIIAVLVNNGMALFTTLGRVVASVLRKRMKVRLALEGVPTHPVGLKSGNSRGPQKDTPEIRPPGNSLGSSGGFFNCSSCQL